MPVSAIRKDYLLSEAIQLIGRRLFGPEWSGQEITHPPVPAPEELARVREPFCEAVKKIEADIAAIDETLRHKLLSETKTRDFKKTRASKLKAHEQAIRELNSHPEPTESHAERYKNYQRRRMAQNRLIDAFKSATLIVHNGEGMPFDNLLWKGHPNFGYDIRLSAVRLPSTYGRPRFQPARISQAQFDAWLETLEPIVKSAAPPLSPEERCAEFLRKQVATGPQTKTKAAYFAQARATISGLSERAFNRVWHNEAPREWKSGGRRPWPKKSPQADNKSRGD